MGVTVGIVFAVEEMTAYRVPCNLVLLVKRMSPCRVFAATGKVGVIIKRLHR